MNKYFVALIPLTMLFLAACVPSTVIEQSGHPTSPVQEDTAHLDAAAAQAILGCAEGGAAVHSPADLRCYLDAFGSEQVLSTNEDIALLIFPSDSVANWVGGAHLYHIPSVSAVGFDFNGYVNPEQLFVETDAAWSALRAVLFDETLMEEFRRAIQDEWQLPDPEEVTLKLGVAYQEKNRAVLLWSFAGLDADDSSFYCLGQSWTIGGSSFEVVPSCEEYHPPTERLGQMEHELDSTSTSATLSIGQLTSNTIAIVRE